MTDAARYNVERFYGSVVLTEYTYTPKGHQYIVLTGWVSVLEAADMVGFKIKHDPTANWVARIQGLRTSYNIPGCKVRAIITHPEDESDLDASVVLVVP